MSEQRMSNKEIREALLEGADYIDQYGWYRGGFCKYNFHDSRNPAACLLGSLFGGLREDGSIPFDFDEHQDLERYLNEFFGPKECAVSFNDRVAESAQEVIDFMIGAAYSIDDFRVDPA